MPHKGKYRSKSSEKIPKKLRGTKIGHMMSKKAMRKMMKGGRHG